MSIRDQLGPEMAMFGFDYGADATSLPSNCINLDAALRDASSEPLSGPPIGNYADKMLYIFTSGTTGLPKAAVIRHSRYDILLTFDFASLYLAALIYEFTIKTVWNSSNQFINTL